MRAHRHYRIYIAIAVVLAVIIAGATFLFGRTSSPQYDERGAEIFERNQVDSIVKYYSLFCPAVVGYSSLAANLSLFQEEVLDQSSNDIFKEADEFFADKVQNLGEVSAKIANIPLPEIPIVLRGQTNFSSANKELLSSINNTRTLLTEFNGRNNSSSGDGVAVDYLRNLNELHRDISQNIAISLEGYLKTASPLNEVTVNAVREKSECQEVFGPWPVVSEGEVVEGEVRIHSDLDMFTREFDDGNSTLNKIFKDQPASFQEFKSSLEAIMENRQTLLNSMNEKVSHWSVVRDGNSYSEALIEYYRDAKDFTGTKISDMIERDRNFLTLLNQTGSESDLSDLLSQEKEIFGQDVFDAQRIAIHVRRVIQISNQATREAIVKQNE